MIFHSPFTCDRSSRTAVRLLVAALLCFVGGWSGGAAEPTAGNEELAPIATTDFAFVSQGVSLSGIISQPAQQEAKALIVLVHGYGRTDVRGWNMYADLRARFAALGIASVTWDKPGQGRSEGTFDINQPVTSSAQEVLDAVAYLRAKEIPGARKIGLWGISRAGWIAPIALSRDHAITFWISVSGVTAEDNYFYLLQSNLPYEGSGVEEAQLLMREWKSGYALFCHGASYEEFCAATKNLRANTYIAKMTGDQFTRETYEGNQAELRAGRVLPPVDPETGMGIYIEKFEAMLSGLQIPVLALFGEKDLNVDWRRTRALYQSTFGANPHASLTVKSFPNANHNIDVCSTGSMREMQSMARRQKSEGYYASQIEWLKTHVLNR